MASGPLPILHPRVSLYPQKDLGPTLGFWPSRSYLGSSLDLHPGMGSQGRHSAGGHNPMWRGCPSPEHLPVSISKRPGGSVGRTGNVAWELSQDPQGHWGGTRLVSVLGAGVDRRGGGLPGFKNMCCESPPWAQAGTRVARAAGLCLELSPCDSRPHHWLLNLPAQQTKPRPSHPGSPW